MMGESPKTVIENIEKPSAEFDLHIEKLSNKFKQITCSWKLYTIYHTFKRFNKINTFGHK